MTKPTPPWLPWILIWPTAGIYWVFWAFSMMQEINRLSGSRVFHTKRIAFVAVCWFGAYCALLWAGSNAFNARDLFCYVASCACAGLLAVTWIAAVARLHGSMARHIGDLESQRGMEDRATFRRGILFFFLWYTVVAYLPRHYNSLVCEESPKP